MKRFYKGIKEYLKSLNFVIKDYGEVVLLDNAICLDLGKNILNIKITLGFRDVSLPLGEPYDFITIKLVFDKFSIEDVSSCVDECTEIAYQMFLECMISFLSKYFPKYKESKNLEDLNMYIQISAAA